ncbi:BAR domain-containing protein [Gordonia insulae]|uniref:Uncharacterized protein n=1 Tax=Gordonia insulae TaxID=2420509 RepID=A0A3G8JRL7_9ACTN|nr:hypothetical protein [Gordonia insulae]AZG47169.1 hypothetical protein D7316_03777 [Gordonia insulae]
MVSVGDIDRWNSEMVREVFRQTQANIANCDTTITRFTNLDVFNSWSGKTAEASKDSISQTIKDFSAHRDQAATISLAAKQAADDIDSVKSKLASIRSDANSLGLSVQPDGKVAGPTPPLWPTWSTAQQTDYLMKKQAIQDRLDRLLVEAGRVDDDLAAVIDGADGDLPVEDVDPLTNTSSVTRKKNQIKAFHDRFGFDPRTDNDWKLAEILDTNTYNPVNKGVDSSVVVKTIDKVPGGGLQRINAFIPRDSVNNIPYQNRGDARGFDPNAGPEDSRVSIYVDYDRGVVVMRQNPSVEIPSGAVKVGTPTMGVAQDGDRVQVTFEAKDPYMPFYDQKVGQWASSTVGTSVRGTLITEPFDGAAPALDGQLPNYPAWEVYNDSESGTTTPVYKFMPDPSDPWGPAKHLPGHHEVSVGGN